MDLRTRRELLGLTQAQVAAIAGCSQAAVSYLELGRADVRSSRQRVLAGLAEALQCSVDDVIASIQESYRVRTERLAAQRKAS